MKKKKTFVVISTLSVLLLLGGCVQPLTSPERHAKHVIVRTLNGSEPSSPTGNPQNMRVLVDFFDHFYQLGKKDKDRGLTTEQEQQRLGELKSDNVIDGFPLEQWLRGKSYTRGEFNAWRGHISKEITGAYLDGYEGRK